MALKMNLRKGPLTKDVGKIFVFLTPYPPCPHVGMIYKTKITQPPLLLGQHPSPPLVRMLARSIELKSRNLPFFWANTPSLLSVDILYE